MARASAFPSGSATSQRQPCAPVQSRQPCTGVRGSVGSHPGEVTNGHPGPAQRRGMRLLVYLLVSWAANAVILAIVAWAFDDVHAGTNGQLLAAAAVFGILNTILKPVMRLLTLPLALVTLGIAWFGVSMLMLWITDALVSGFDVDGFWTYVWATFLIWSLNLVIDLVEFASRRRSTSPADTVALSH